MNTHSTLTTTIATAVAAAAAALILVAPAAQAAQAAQVDRFDRSTFDSTPDVSDSGYAMAGATAGELGGYLELAVQASDGTLPAQGDCEIADVQAVLTVSPGESFSIVTTGELCSHFIDGTPSLNAYFGAKQVSYTGAHKHARVTNGSIGFQHTFLGSQGQVGLSVRW